MANIAFVTTQKLVELLKEADLSGLMAVKISSTSRLALGADPLKPTLIIDLAKESVSPFKPESSAAVPTAKAAEPFPSSEGASRNSGDYWLEIGKNRKQYRNLKFLLRDGLLAIENMRPGTFEKLTLKGNKKRIVARDRNQLFELPHLVESFSAKLSGDWWYGTNNSFDEVTKWLRKGCDCAGLSWGADVNVGR
jgi:hypothetical protein